MEGAVSLEVEEARPTEDEVVPMDIVAATHTSRDTSTHGYQDGSNACIPADTLNTSDMVPFGFWSTLVTCYSHITSGHFPNTLSVCFEWT